jgi:ATP-dependent Clp protease ATP-binding subunit ClpA
MFAGYTEKARRAVFFARQEAIQSGASQIEAEDLLIGLLRENRDLLPQVLESDVDSLRTEIKGRVPRLESVPQVMTMPLSTKTKKVLANAADESATLGHEHITTAHLMLSLLREPAPFMVEVFQRYDLDLEVQRERLRFYVEPPLVRDFTFLRAISGVVRRALHR